MKFDVVRAWKDENYRQSLNEEQRGSLPAHPAGEIELADAEMESIYGGGGYGGGGPVGGAGALSSSDSFGNGGFGFNNFNRLTVSSSCSRNCSFGCDIRQD